MWLYWRLSRELTKCFVSGFVSQGQSIQCRASRQPALWCLCWRFHLGANTILRLSFSAHRCQRETGREGKKNGKVKRKWITPRGTPHTTGFWFLFVSQSVPLQGCPARWPTTNIKNKWKEASWHPILSSRCVCVCVWFHQHTLVYRIFSMHNFTRHE